MIFKNKKALIEALDIERGTYVLDVGFVGQATRDGDINSWPHAFLKAKSDHVYGVDLEFNTQTFPQPYYLEGSAEDFSFPIKFDVIFAGDLIEHISNAGLFLQACKSHLKPQGRLILTTPNAFSFFPIIEKLTHDEPNVNPDHTCYFNKKVMAVLLQKNGITNFTFGYIYTLGTLWRGGIKRKILASIYWLLSEYTPKFLETMVVTITI